MVKHGGIPTEDSYGPYMGQDGYCHLNESTVGLKIKGFVNVTSGTDKTTVGTNVLKRKLFLGGEESIA